VRCVSMGGLLAMGHGVRRGARVGKYSGAGDGMEQDWRLWRAPTVDGNRDYRRARNSRHVRCQQTKIHPST
jgi:hypothetical protein